MFTSLDFEGVDFSPQAIIATLESVIQGVIGEGFQLDEIGLGENIQEALSSLVSWFGNIAISLG
jgi:hypothetical protein